MHSKHVNDNSATLRYETQSASFPNARCWKPKQHLCEVAFTVNGAETRDETRNLHAIIIKALCFTLKAAKVASGSDCYMPLLNLADANVKPWLTNRINTNY